jgi:phage gp36-like protein
VAGSVYSSESDLNLDPNRIIELTELPSAIGQKDQATLDATSLEAQDDVDEMLAGVYVVPFTAGNVPGPIRRIHADRWRYLLFKRRDVMAIPDSVKDEWAAAEKKLEDYASPGDGGRVLLGAARVSSATGPAPTGGSFSSDVYDTRPARRIFGRYRDLP